MNKIIILIHVIAMISACNAQSISQQQADAIDTTIAKQEIQTMLDSFNTAAAQADFDAYFNFFTDDAVFLGTDATEHWNKTAFEEYAKPHFEAKKTWNFTALKRNIYFGQHADVAWFDELLDTQMKICRGSGVVLKTADGWKVAQYVLSMTIPNDQVKSAIQLKEKAENPLIEKLKSK